MNEAEKGEFPQTNMIEFVVNPGVKVEVKQAVGVCNPYRLHSKGYKICECLPGFIPCC